MNQFWDWRRWFGRICYNYVIKIIWKDVENGEEDGRVFLIFVSLFFFSFHMLTDPYVRDLWSRTLAPPSRLRVRSADVTWSRARVLVAASVRSRRPTRAVGPGALRPRILRPPKYRPHVTARGDQQKWVVVERFPGEMDITEVSRGFEWPWVSGGGARGGVRWYVCLFCFGLPGGTDQPRPVPRRWLPRLAVAGVGLANVNTDKGHPSWQERQADTCQQNGWSPSQWTAVLAWERSQVARSRISRQTGHVPLNIMIGGDSRLAAVQCALPVGARIGYRDAWCNSPCTIFYCPGRQPASHSSRNVWMNPMCTFTFSGTLLPPAWIVWKAVRSRVFPRAHANFFPQPLHPP